MQDDLVRTNIISFCFQTSLSLSLSLQKRIIIHEVGHALGLHHEQTRPDRDNYVTIVSGNIAPNLLYNFQRYTWRTIQNFNVPYDYYSIMHYGKTVSALDSVSAWPALSRNTAKR